MNTAWLVYIATLSTSGGYLERYSPMASMEQCIETTKAAQVKVPQGGDAESTVALFCTALRPKDPNEVKTKP